MTELSQSIGIRTVVERRYSSDRLLFFALIVEYKLS
jgi:hypothetical protein